VLRYADRGDQGSAEKLSVLGADQDSGVAVPAVPKRRGRAELSAGKLGTVMNLPTLATLALVLAYPIGYAAYLSFHKVTPAELRRGVFPTFGLSNYQRILSDPLFLLALKNTLIFTAVTVLSSSRWGSPLRC
jgi:multiple sugar transport system permease protein